jgi:phosphate:Na+ symporter
MSYSVILLGSAVGLIMLLVGMQLMRSGLEGAARHRLRGALGRITGTPLLAALTGLVITMLVQSSTAVTVLTVGLVNARLLGLVQAVGIVLGSNVGTCITVQMLAFDFTRVAIPLTVLGGVLWATGKGSLANPGKALFGFGYAFLGLHVMATSFAPLQQSPWFAEVIHSLGYSHLLALVAGAGTSALLHSSSASTGIVMLLYERGLMPLSTAVAVVLGNNIGTCITAVLASLWGSVAGRQVAVAHVLLNIIGAAVFLPLLPLFTALVAATSDSLSRQVANAHTLYNFISSAAVLPLIHPFTKLVEMVVPVQFKRN